MTGTVSSIEEVVKAQHRRIQALLESVRVALAQGAWPAVADEFRQLRQLVEGHMEAEEREMFPALEQALSERRAFTDGLREEHTQFRATLAYIGLCIDVEDQAATWTTLERL